MNHFVRLLLISFLFAMSTSSLAADRAELEPGDHGYRHEELHKYYLKLFAKGKCFCRTGACRPTSRRENVASPTGFDVLIDGEWVHVPREALQEKQSVPAELWVDPAHVCAYPNPAGGGFVIECVILNAGV